MRVAFVLNALGTGGAEIHTVTLAAALRERGHECLLAPLLPLTEIDPKGLPRAAIDGNGLGNVQAMRRLAEVMRDWRADVVVAVNERPTMYAHMMRITGGPVLPTVVVYHSTRMRTLKERVLIRLAQPLIARSDALVFVSENQRRHWLENGLTARRTVAIPNGIDPTRFTPAATHSHRAEKRAELGFRDGDYVLGLSAAFRSEKNHGQAIEAVAALRAQGLPAKLLLVGDGPLSPAIRATALARRVESAVVFAGRQGNVIPWLSACDVGLLTSRTEAFSLAALEIMALGIPCVLSNVGGASEMIDDGETGRLFAVDDTSALVAALVELADPARRRKMGEKAGKKVQREFVQERMVAQYEALLAEVTGG